MDLSTVKEKIKSIVNKLEHDKFLSNLKREELLFELRNLVNIERDLKAVLSKSSNQIIDTLISLGNELDKSNFTKYANEVDKILEDLSIEDMLDKLEMKEKCKACSGTGMGEDSPWCEVCKGEGKIAGSSNKLSFNAIEVSEEELVKIAYIRKRKGKYVVFSHKGKPMGSYKTRSEAVKRLKQIEFFKNKGKKK